MPKQKFTRITVWVAQGLGEWLRSYAYRTKTSKGSVVRKALEEFKAKLKQR